MALAVADGDPGRPGQCQSQSQRLCEPPVVAAFTDELRIRWLDGTQSNVPWSWLRDACPCDACRAGGGRSRRLDVTTLELPVAAPRVDVDAAAGTLILEWPAPGTDHVSTWPFERLHEVARRLDSRRVRGGSAGGNGTRRLPAGPVVIRRAWTDVTSSPEALAALLDGVVAHGVALVTGVPVRAGAAAEVVGLFGSVRQTSHGRVFDVGAGPDTDGPAVAPHTDDAYRDPAPTVQVLQCLRDAPGGGNTVLVDGFDAVARLDRRYPAAGRLLRRYPQRWVWADETTYLEAVALVIDEAPGVGLRQVRFDERARTPASAPSDVVTDVLVALAAFARVVATPGLQARLHLAPGDALILDNRRMLHGRTARDGSGPRWLQGCYADMDSLHSRLAVLRRDGA